jgi:alanine dehydrogenase
MAILDVMTGIKEVRAYDPDNSRLTAFLRESKTLYPKVTMSGESEAETVVRNSDICITLTPSRNPHIRAEWVRPGTHLCAIGADAPGKQELDPQILKHGTIIVDDMEQAAHAGEINIPLKDGIINREDVKSDLASIVLGKVQGRTSQDEVTIFDSTGLAMQDAVIAKHAYDRAVEMGLGQRLDLVL